MNLSSPLGGPVASAIFVGIDFGNGLLEKRLGYFWKEWR